MYYGCLILVCFLVSKAYSNTHLPTNLETTGFGGTFHPDHEKPFCHQESLPEHLSKGECHRTHPSAPADSNPHGHDTGSSFHHGINHGHFHGNEETSINRRHHAPEDSNYQRPFEQDIGSSFQGINPGQFHDIENAGVEERPSESSFQPAPVNWDFQGPVFHQPDFKNSNFGESTVESNHGAPTPGLNQDTRLPNFGYDENFPPKPNDGDSPHRSHCNLPYNPPYYRESESDIFDSGESPQQSTISDIGQGPQRGNFDSNFDNFGTYPDPQFGIDPSSPYVDFIGGGGDTTNFGNLESGEGLQSGTPYNDNRQDFIFGGSPSSDSFENVRGSSDHFDLDEFPEFAIEPPILPENPNLNHFGDFSDDENYSDYSADEISPDLNYDGPVYIDPVTGIEFAANYGFQPTSSCSENDSGDEDSLTPKPRRKASPKKKSPRIKKLKFCDCNLARKKFWHKIRHVHSTSGHDFSFKKFFRGFPFKKTFRQPLKRVGRSSRSDFKSCRQPQIFKFSRVGKRTTISASGGVELHGKF